MGMLGGGMNSSDEHLENLRDQSNWLKGFEEGQRQLFDLMRKVAGKTITRSISQQGIEAHRTPYEWAIWARRYVSE